MHRDDAIPAARAAALAPRPRPRLLAANIEAFDDDLRSGSATPMLSLLAGIEPALLSEF